MDGEWGKLRQGEVNDLTGLPNKVFGPRHPILSHLAHFSFLFIQYLCRNVMFICPQETIPTGGLDDKESRLRLAAKSMNWLPH